MLVAALLASMIGCGDKKPPPAEPQPAEPRPQPQPAEPQPQPPQPPGDGPATHVGHLDVPVSVRSSAELKARLTITNPGPVPLTLTRGALDLPMLALEVRRDGARVNPLPPPVPRPEDAERVVIAAGATLTRDYLLNVYSPELPAGAYTLHCLAVSCPPAPFTVAP